MNGETAAFFIHNIQALRMLPNLQFIVNFHVFRKMLHNNFAYLDSASVLDLRFEPCTLIYRDVFLKIFLYESLPCSLIKIVEFDHKIRKPSSLTLANKPITLDVKGNPMEASL